MFDFIIAFDKILYACNAIVQIVCNATSFLFFIFQIVEKLSQ